MANQQGDAAGLAIAHFTPGALNPPVPYFKDGKPIGGACPGQLPTENFRRWNIQIINISENALFLIGLGGQY